ncbi:Scr1 family TA system antitoxin-like transcriptional regulator [Streptomyces roseoverticillatus]|uniref:DUF397 domain-containing protein n=1 Tax=Streptomyces roseoverticillatus TaxID=66429 RepID=UPI0033FBEADD
MALEAEAIAFHWYELSLIPGLLQTEDYARALLTSRYPPVDEEVVEERVVTRLERQAVLLHLVEAGKARNVSLQVMPIGSTVGIDGSFIVLETPENRLYKISALSQAIRIRDSKRKHGPQLAVGAPAWEAFVAYAPAAAR